LVSFNFFEALRVSPILGRTLSSPANAPLVDTRAAIISHGYWSRRFGASPDVVGRPFTINGISFTVTGVAPQQFAGVWLESPVGLPTYVKPLNGKTAGTPTLANSIWSEPKYSDPSSVLASTNIRPWSRAASPRASSSVESP
jgi:hypothetical protein